MSIAVNVNGKDYYDKEEARAAWFEEWLMKQDFEQDLIDRENELEYRRTHPDWNIPYVMYGVRKKHKCIDMSKYQTEAGIECTPEECKLIDSLKRLAKKWEKDGKRLWLYSASGSLHVMMHGDTDYNPTPEFTQYGGGNIENSVTTIYGILNDGGDW